MAYLCSTKYEKYINKEKKVNGKPLTNALIIENIVNFIKNIIILTFKIKTQENL